MLRVKQSTTRILIEESNMHDAKNHKGKPRFLIATTRIDGCCCASNPLQTSTALYASCFVNSQKNVFIPKTCDVNFDFQLFSSSHSRFSLLSLFLQACMRTVCQLVTTGMICHIDRSLLHLVLVFSIS